MEGTKLTKAEFGEVLSGTFNWSDKRGECCNYILIDDQYTFKNVQITFKLKNLKFVAHVRRNILERQGKDKLN